MNNMRVLLILFILAIMPVYAAEPNEETACCLQFQQGVQELPEQCNQFDINKDRCKLVVEDYNAITASLGNPNTSYFFLVALVFVLIIVVIIWLIWYLIGRFRK